MANTTAGEVAPPDANQQFAGYVRAVEAGESLVITRRGKPVARLVPSKPGRRVLPPEHQAARRAGCTIALREGMHDGAKLAGIAVRNPFAGRALADDLRSLLGLEAGTDIPPR